MKPLPNSFFEDTLKRPSVFIDEGKLSFDYVPKKLPHREEPLERLMGFFRSLAERPGSVSVKVMLKGTLGSGKTSLSRRFGDDLEKHLQRKGVNFKYFHVNCREAGSFFNILKSLLLSHFEPKLARRGYSAPELLQRLTDQLDKRNIYLIIALDEVESLIAKEGSDPLFLLTRLDEGRPLNAPRRVSSLFIFREPDCEKVLPLLDKSTLSTLGHNTLTLTPYTAPQLRDILNYRIEETFREGIVTEEAVGLIADMAGEMGDARLAVELLWLAGKYADTKGSNIILPEHVREAQLKVAPPPREVDLRFLEPHERLLLLAVCRQLKGVDDAYVRVGEMEETYRAVCEEYRETSRGHTQIWKYLKRLAALGLVSTKISGEGRRGKSTLIGLPIPPDRLESEIVAILEKTRHPRRGVI